MTALTKTIFDSIAGELEYNSQSNCYEGSLEIEDIDLFADLFVDAESPEGLTLALDVLRTALNQIASVLELGKQAACRDFLETYNEGWRQDNPPIVAYEFMSRLEALSVWVDKHCEFGFSFHTDDMFPGYAIRVDFDRELKNATTRLW